METKHYTSKTNQKWILATLTVCFLNFVAGAQVYNVNYNDINFGGTGVTITNKVGNGTAVGDIVLYEDIITISGQAIDAIVRTELITNGTCTLFDYTGTGQNNLERWFSPQFNFNAGGGYVEFQIDFISGGSYNNGTNTGTPVTLQNVMVNSYDIDGNGNANSNQYCDFGGFAYAEIGNPTNLTYAYDSSSGLTRFSSTTSANNTNAADERHRVRCTYSAVSSFTLRLGGGGSGAAYYFIDFSADPPFNSSTTLEVPVLDLDTSTPGHDHDTTYLGAPVAFTEGSLNIDYSGASIDSLKIQFDQSMIQDGNSEILYFRGTGNSQIGLDFTHQQSIPDISLGGQIYSVHATVVNGRSKLVFYKNGGTMLLSNIEAFLDSIDYHNLLSPPTVDPRTFDVSVQVDEFVSGIAQFNVNYDVTLPIELLSFEVKPAENKVNVAWKTATELNSDLFYVERSKDGTDWETVAEIEGAGTSTVEKEYHCEDSDAPVGTSYYRLVQRTLNGSEFVYAMEAATVLEQEEKVKISTSNGSVTAIMPESWSGQITFFNNQGKIVYQKNILRTDPRQLEIQGEWHSEIVVYHVQCISSLSDINYFSMIF